MDQLRRPAGGAGAPDHREHGAERHEQSEPGRQIPHAALYATDLGPVPRIADDLAASNDQRGDP
jgi:hypothetical protein